MKRLGEMLHRARAELACPTCGNNPRGHMGNECPECHGELRNPATIELLEQLTLRVDQLEGVVQP